VKWSCDNFRVWGSIEHYAKVLRDPLGVTYEIFLSAFVFHGQCLEMNSGKCSFVKFSWDSFRVSGVFEHYADVLRDSLGISYFVFCICARFPTMLRDEFRECSKIKFS